VIPSLTLLVAGLLPLTIALWRLLEGTGDPRSARSRSTLIGPLAVTFAVLLWTVLASRYSGHRQGWPVVPILAGFLLVCSWHAWLVLRGPKRCLLAAYGLGHMLVWVPFGMACLMAVSHDSI